MMDYERFLIYSLRRNRAIRVLLADETLRYVNLTVLSLDQDEITVLKSGRKRPQTIRRDQILAASYARGDNGDTTGEFYQLPINSEEE